MKVTHFRESIAFMAPVGLSAAVTAAAPADHTSRSEFLRRAIIARLREVGVSLDTQTQANQEAIR